MEVVDEELEETLLGLQIEVDELLVEVTRYRSEVPGQVAQALADRLHQSIPCLRPLSPTQADADAPVAGKGAKLPSLCLFLCSIRVGFAHDARAFAESCCRGRHLAHESDRTTFFLPYADTVSMRGTAATLADLAKVTCMRPVKFRGECRV